MCWWELTRRWNWAQPPVNEMHDRTLIRKYHNFNIWISHNIPMNAIQNRNFIGMYG